MTILNTGNVGIGTTAPAAITHIASTGADGLTLLRLQDSNTICDFTADTDGGPSCGSDLRLKKDIATIASGSLEKLLSLDVVNYHWKTDSELAPLQTGFIAQNVQQFFPDLITTSTWNDGQPALFMSQAGLIPYLVKGIQELASQQYQLTDVLAARSAVNDSVEVYPFESDVQEGMLVVPSSTSFVITDGQKLPRLLTTSRPYDPTIIGVMSAADADTIDHDIPQSANPNPVALTGRAAVLVSLENGPIKVGDHITSSETPGIGMRATEPGHIVGMALESLDTVASGSYGRVLVSVDAGYWAPSIASILSADGDTTVSDPGLIAQIASNVVAWLRDTLDITLENGLVKTVKGWFAEVQTDKLCVGDTCLDEAQLKALLENAEVAPLLTPTPIPEGLTITSCEAEDEWQWTITNGSSETVSFNWQLGPTLASISGQDIAPAGGSATLLTIPYSQDPFLYVAPVGESFGTGTAFQGGTCMTVEETPTPTPAPSTSPSPSVSPASSPEPSMTPTPTLSPSSSPSVSPSPSPSTTPSATPEPTPEPTPSETPTPTPEP